MIAESNYKIQLIDETVIILGDGEETASNTRTHEHAMMIS
jgi:hypothetical protein